MTWSKRSALIPVFEKSEVSRICVDLDAEVATFRDRDLARLEFPYVFLDATYCKARVNHRIVSQAIVVAVGVAADGRREVLGFDVGDSENEPFWTAFLRSLKARGLGGVRLIMSDAHTGLKKAIGTVFQGASWQRCRPLLPKPGQRACSLRRMKRSGLPPERPTGMPVARKH